MPIQKHRAITKRLGHLHVKKGDQVLILAGKDAGRRGPVLQSLPGSGRVVVENLNLVTKHQRPRQGMAAGVQDQVGRIRKPASLHASNVMLICPSCDKPTRPAHTVTQSGQRVRVCRRCKEFVDKV